MGDATMLELFSFLFSLGSAIKNIFDGFKSSEQKKFAKKIHQIHIQLQVIIDSADRIFTLIKTADKQINEYGEAKFKRIIQENFRSQFERLIDLASRLQDQDMSLVFDKLDNDLRQRLRSIIGFKGDSIRNAILQITHSKLKIENKELYITIGKNKVNPFPDLDIQIKTLSKLKKCSKSLGTNIYSAVSLKDLL